MARQFVIYCDESEIKGAVYSNFYGGALIRTQDSDNVITRLERKKQQLNLFQEIKWQKVSGAYLQKYMGLMDEFFDLIREDKVKIRVMFTHRNFQPQNLEQYHREHEYFILYYQFIKHAFGLRYSNDTGAQVTVRIFFDNLPNTKEKRERFKDFVYGINRWPELRKAKIHILRDQIAEVDSHKHVIMQCLDVVIGAMQFRLNDKHTQKPPGSNRRGKRTIAKEKLYKHINSGIRHIYPGFNIGISTGKKGDIANLWKHPYRHWLFHPSDSNYQGNAER
jgi:hypothetical protein